MLMKQLPILLIIIPLLCAPLIVLIQQRTAAWLINVAACLICSVIGIALLQEVLSNGAISYALGGWLPPIGIEYRIDLLSCLLVILVSVCFAAVLIFARHSIPDEIPKPRIIPLYCVVMLAFAGLLGICVSGDIFNLFVFLEISSLATYTLISMGRDKRALYAAFKYLVMGTIGATFILIGISFLYIQTGTLNMQDLAERLPALYDNRTIRAGFAFFTVGIGLKLAMFPLHLWLPNAYAYAPSAVSALLAATATKVAVYMLLRLLLSIFDPEFSLQRMPLHYILIALGAVAILSCSMVAIFQVNLKRLLAYSSIAQLGYIVMAIGLSSAAGLSASLLHLLNHGLMKGALFIAIGAMAYRQGTLYIQDNRSLLQTMPITAIAFIIASLSLVGVPGTVGFVSKWYMVQAAIAAGFWPLAIVIILGSLMALVYVSKILQPLFVRMEVQGPRLNHQDAPLSMLLPMCFLVAANLYFGLNTEWTYGLATQAIAEISGGRL